MSGNASTCVSMMMLLKSSRQRLISIEQKGCIAKLTAVVNCSVMNMFVTGVGADS